MGLGKNVSAREREGERERERETERDRESVFEERCLHRNTFQSEIVFYSLHGPLVLKILFCRRTLCLFLSLSLYPSLKFLSKSLILIPP